jgi:hypothetical protein
MRPNDSARSPQTVPPTPGGRAGHNLLAAIGAVLVSPVILLVLIGGSSEMGLGLVGAVLAVGVYLGILGCFVKPLWGAAREWWRTLD